jgi:hypothetical protein
VSISPQSTTHGSTGPVSRWQIRWWSMGGIHHRLLLCSDTDICTLGSSWLLRTFKATGVSCVVDFSGSMTTEGSPAWKREVCLGSNPVWVEETVWEKQGDLLFSLWCCLGFSCSIGISLLFCCSSPILPLTLQLEGSLIFIVVFLQRAGWGGGWWVTGSSLCPTYWCHSLTSKSSTIGIKFQREVSWGHNSNHSKFIIIFYTFVYSLYIYIYTLLCIVYRQSLKHWAP